VGRVRSLRRYFALPLMAMLVHLTKKLPSPPPLALQPLASLSQVRLRVVVMMMMMIMMMMPLMRGDMMMLSMVEMLLLLLLMMMIMMMMMMMLMIR
jgi:hypothetical protein